MALPKNMTKIICTIGPASNSPDILRQMITAGMNVARINFSHSDFAAHREVIANVREAARAVGRRVAILADLPGPKVRIGELAKEPLELHYGDTTTLTIEETLGNAGLISVSLPTLPERVHEGDTLFINDGLVELRVLKAEGKNVECRVEVGGEIRSRKGLNLPGIDLGIRAFTESDQHCLEFALDANVDAVSQSFIQSAADVVAVRDAAAAMGRSPFVIAKIERSKALENIDAIYEAADGIMIARGDLGVEIPIEAITLIQKELIRKANLMGKPVITATQMLESMTDNRRPTRAEATDVANAILDGTDCVMLSGESAVGRYPVDSVRMLAKIAAAVEWKVTGHQMEEDVRECGEESQLSVRDLLALSVETAVRHASPAAVIVPTRSGATARSITRFRLPVWITAVSSLDSTCQRLQFTYGVYPVHEPEHPEDWRSFARTWLHDHALSGKRVILTEGPSVKHPETNHRMEIIELG